MLSEVLTVRGFEPMFKGEDEADNIHIVLFNENDFKVVSQKSRFEVGDKALYIFPDTNIPDTGFFSDYYRPDGNPNKSKLGSGGRVKAVKFGWTNREGKKVYSEGIIIPIWEVLMQLDFDNALGLFKEDKEKTINGNSLSTPLPVHKSDETNYKKNSSRIDFTKELIVSIKRDGSSIAVYKKDENNLGICSRSLEKDLTAVTKVYEDWVLKHDKETATDYYFNKKDYSKLSVSELEALELPFTVTKVSDPWITVGTPIMEKLRTYSRNIAIRGEVFGKGMNAHKANADCLLPLSVECYGVDEWDGKEFLPIPMKDAITICEELAIPFVPIVLGGAQVYANKSELEEACNAYIEEHPSIEGLVIRNLNDAKYSGKYMNSVYDERK